MEQLQIIYYPAAERALASAELAEVIGTALDGNPKLEQAVRQLLQQHVAYATASCADPRVSEREAAHSAGRLAEMLSLQHELANFTRQAREIRGAQTGTTRRVRK